MSVSVLNTDANLSAKTLMAAENADTVTGLKTFDRDPNPPFAVSSGSASVANLDADKVDGLEAAAFLRVDGSASLSGGKIPFPAVQVPSTGANDLDDFEEGTWTPTIVSGGGGTPTYSAQAGKYIKVGKLVTIFGRIALATKGTLAAGNISIQGLPFASENVSNQYTAVPLSWNAMTTLPVFMIGNIPPNTSQIDVTHITAAAAGMTSTTVADVSATVAFVFSASYAATA